VSFLTPFFIPSIDNKYRSQFQNHPNTVYNIGFSLKIYKLSSLEYDYLIVFLKKKHFGTLNCTNCYKFVVAYNGISLNRGHYE